MCQEAHLAIAKCRLAYHQVPVWKCPPFGKVTSTQATKRPGAELAVTVCDSYGMLSTEKFVKQCLTLAKRGYFQAK